MEVIQQGGEDFYVCLSFEGGEDAHFRVVGVNKSIYGL